MFPLAVTVFLASLLGSVHCVGMCGPFVALTASDRDGRKLVASGAAYHGGRLFSYMVLGLLAGALGAGLDLGAAAFGVQRVALVICGALMIAFGAVVLLRSFGVRLGRLAPPAWLGRTYLALSAPIRRLPPASRALSIGVLSTLLPCGWLYAFVITAAGTGSPVRGALTMAAFWLGTVPLLVALGLGVGRLLGPARRHVPVLSAAALIIVGLLAVGARFRVPVLQVSDQEAAATLDEGLERVEGLDAGAAPCCASDES